MRSRWAVVLGVATASVQLTLAQGGSLTLPKTVEAGAAFSITSSGNGKTTLYIVGPNQVLKRDVQLGEVTNFAAGTLFNAGHYVAILAGSSSADNDGFDVVPAAQPADLSFFAKPSRLQVGLHGAITGAAYVFDAYRNLITVPTPVSFELTGPSGTLQKRIATTREGAAWSQMDSTPQQGKDKFVARVSDLSSTRVIVQVPGDPCGLRMSAQPAGQKIHLATDPVRDCSGNAVPDGTIITFTETYGGSQSVVDVPLKRGIAEVQMPAHAGAMISVASGVALGNQIRWEK